MFKVRFEVKASVMLYERDMASLPGPSIGTGGFTPESAKKQISQAMKGGREKLQSLTVLRCQLGFHWLHLLISIRNLPLVSSDAGAGSARPLRMRSVSLTLCKARKLIDGDN